MLKLDFQNIKSFFKRENSILEKGDEGEIYFNNIKKRGKERWESHGEILDKYFELLKREVSWYEHFESKWDEAGDEVGDDAEGVLLEDILEFHEELIKKLEEHGYTLPYSEYHEDTDLDFAALVREYFEFRADTKVYGKRPRKIVIYETGDGMWKIFFDYGWGYAEESFRKLYYETIEVLNDREFEQFINIIKESVKENRIVKPDGVFITKLINSKQMKQMKIFDFPR